MNRHTSMGDRSVPIRRIPLSGVIVCRKFRCFSNYIFDFTGTFGVLTSAVPQ